MWAGFQLGTLCVRAYKGLREGSLGETDWGMCRLRGELDLLV